MRAARCECVRRERCSLIEELLARRASLCTRALP